MSGDKEEINYWNKRLDGPILLSGMHKHGRKEGTRNKSFDDGGIFFNISWVIIFYTEVSLNAINVPNMTTAVNKTLESIEFCNFSKKIWYSKRVCFD